MMAINIPKDVADLLESLNQELTDIEKAIIGEDGKEYNNPKPVKVHAGPRKLTLKEQLKRVMREIEHEAVSQGEESIEEAMNFDTGEDKELEDHEPYPAMDPDLEMLKKSEEKNVENNGHSEGDPVGEETPKGDPSSDSDDPGGDQPS